MFFGRKSKIMLVNAIANSEGIARRLEQSHKELGDKMEAISKADIKARDRVDISLEEYERLKKENDDLAEENQKLHNVLAMLQLPDIERIDFNRVQQKCVYDIDSMKNVCHIRFELK